MCDSYNATVQSWGDVIDPDSPEMMRATSAINRCYEGEQDSTSLYWIVQGLLCVYFVFQVIFEFYTPPRTIHWRTASPVDLAHTSSSRLMSVLIAIMVLSTLGAYLVDSNSQSSTIGQRIFSSFLVIPLLMIARYTPIRMSAAICGFIVFVLQFASDMSKEAADVSTLYVMRSVAPIANISSVVQGNSAIVALAFHSTYDWPIASAVLRILPRQAATLFAAGLALLHGCVIVHTRTNRWKWVGMLLLRDSRLLKSVLESPFVGYVEHVRGLLTSKGQPSPPPFIQLSTRFSMALAGTQIIVYYIVIQAMTLVLGLSVSFSAAIGQLNNIAQTFGTESVAPLASLVVGCLVGVGTVVVVLSWLLTTYVLAFDCSHKYRQHILRLRKGDYWFPQEGCTVADAHRFVGYAVGFVGAGLLVIMTVTTFLVSLIMLVIVILTQLPHSVTQAIWESIRDNIITYVLGPAFILLITFIILDVLASLFLTADARLAIIHPRLLSWLDILQSCFMVFRSVISVISFTLLYLARIALMSIQVHVPLLGSENMASDIRYRAYLGCLVLDHFRSNPVLRVAVALLRAPLESVSSSFGAQDTLIETEKDVLGSDFAAGVRGGSHDTENARTKIRALIAETRVRMARSKPFTDSQLRTGIGSEAVVANQSLEVSDDLEARRVLQAAQRRMRAINRWFVARTLLRNPQLISARRTVPLASKQSSRSFFQTTRELMTSASHKVRELVARSRTPKMIKVTPLGVELTPISRTSR